MNTASITALIVAITALITALTTLVSHFQLRRSVKASSSPPATARSRPTSPTGG